MRGTALSAKAPYQPLRGKGRGFSPAATRTGVPPELVLDAGFGELFIVRVAGNVLLPEVVGSIRYALSRHERKTKVRWTADAEMATMRRTAHADHSRRSSLHPHRQPRCQRSNSWLHEAESAAAQCALWRGFLTDRHHEIHPGSPFLHRLRNDATQRRDRCGSSRRRHTLRCSPGSCAADLLAV